MVLVDTVFMNYSLLSTGSVMFWLVLMISAVIWKNTKDILTTVITIACIIPIYLIGLVSFNYELFLIGSMLFLVWIIMEFVVK